MKVCKVAGCETVVKGHGYCDRHYQQFKRHGESGVDKSVISTHTCKNQVCGKAFVPRHRSQYYCCIECKIADYKATGRIKEVMNRFNKSEKGKARTRRYLDTEKGKIYNRNKSARQRQRLLMIKKRREGMMMDNVNHPAHYKAGNMEVIEVIEAFGLGFHLGNAAKYILRAGRKTQDATEDIKKAIWYLNRFLEKHDGKPTE